VRVLLTSFIALSILEVFVTAELSDEYCIDSEYEFNAWVSKGDLKWAQETKTCDLANNRTKWCNVSEFKRNCPVICGTCLSTPCEDQVGEVTIPPKGKKKTCGATYWEVLCEKYEFAKHCPVTCNFCPYTTLSPAVAPSRTTLTPTFTNKQKKEEYCINSESGLNAWVVNGDQEWVLSWLSRC